MSYPVDGNEKMGNGSGVVTQGVAALALTDAKAKYDTAAGLSWPAETLTITDLFPGETVEFSFSKMPREAQQEFQACFSAAGGSQR